jgi:branched-chain amino acid transport system permease protein
MRDYRRFVLPILIVVSFIFTVGISWLGVIDSYPQLVMTFVGINIIFGASLNLVNGYMREFSVGHAAFMLVGAYTTSVLTVWLFADDSVFGPHVLPPSSAIVLFPIVLIIGGIAAAFASLLVAIPSFNTRGDYLAIVTLAVNFIAISAVENIEVIGGPRGFMGMASVVSAMNRVVEGPWMMFWVFVWTVISLLVIRNFVSSTYGKGVVAIGNDEAAAELMGVDTRRLKVVAFMLSSGLAGVAGGLSAHVLSYVNPGNFGVLKSTEALVLVYLGGMGSLSGSIISGIVFTVLLELLRPLGVLKWVVIPLLLILLMMFRPEGIMGDRELTDVFPRLRSVFKPAEEAFEVEEMGAYAPVSD